MPTRTQAPLHEKGFLRIYRFPSGDGPMRSSPPNFLPVSSGPKPEWNQHEFASDLVIANLIGTWNEKSEADLEIVRQLINEEYSSWILKIREILQLPESPIAMKNGRWSVTARKELWEALGARLFDDNLDSFKQCVVSVLTERDPQFDLPVDERYAASIHRKVLKHSPDLRKGMAESLALLGNQPDVLTNCSQNKPETIAFSGCSRNI